MEERNNNNDDYNNNFNNNNNNSGLYFLLMVIIILLVALLHEENPDFIDDFTAWVSELRGSSSDSYHNRHAVTDSGEFDEHGNWVSDGDYEENYIGNFTLDEIEKMIENGEWEEK